MWFVPLRFRKVGQPEKKCPCIEDPLPQSNDPIGHSLYMRSFQGQLCGMSAVTIELSVCKTTMFKYWICKSAAFLSATECLQKRG